MTIKEYASICKKFSSETAEWLGLDNYKDYRTDGANDWYESFDAANGGIDVSWAFHESDDYIDKSADAHFINAIRELIELGRDDGWMDEQWDMVIDLLS